MLVRRWCHPFALISFISQTERAYSYVYDTESAIKDAEDNFLSCKRSNEQLAADLVKARSDYSSKGTYL